MTHSIIILDDDKQILKQSEIDLSTVAEKINTPYLILIPNNQS